MMNDDDEDFNEKKNRICTKREKVCIGGRRKDYADYYCKLRDRG
jgi:hypothetical protein